MKIVKLFFFFTFCFGFSTPSNKNMVTVKGNPECKVNYLGASSRVIEGKLKNISTQALWNPSGDISRWQVSEHSNLDYRVKETITHVSCVVNNIPSNDGSITLNISSYSGTLTYRWSTINGEGLNEGNKNQEGLSAGDYKIEIFKNGTCIYNNTYTVNAPENFTIQVDKTDNVCYEGKEGVIAISAQGGTPPYQYAIDGGLHFNSNHIFDNLKKGTYAIVVKDAKGCEITESSKISQGAYFSVHHPESITLGNCLSQEEIDTTFKEWLSGFHYNGGTKPVTEEFINNSPPDSCGGTTTVTYIATDGCGVRKECSASFTVPETPEVQLLQQATDFIAECGGDTDAIFQNWLSNNANAKADSSCPITWKNNYNASLWEFTCDNTRSIEILFTAENGCHSIETKATFTIRDTHPPVFVESLPENMTVSCNAIPEVPTLTAIDDCDADVDVAFEESSTTNGCTQIIERTWTAIDCSGNSTAHTQTITVEDTEKPTFAESLPEDITIYCDALPDVPVLTVIDDCDADVDVVFEESSATNGCIQIIERTWTATDCSGNSTAHTQTINYIEDTTAPTLFPSLSSYFVDDITVTCGEIPSIPELAFEDNCSGDVKVVFEETSNYEDESTNYQIIRTWTVTDLCNNEAVYTQTILVNLENSTNTPIHHNLALCVEDFAYNLERLLTYENDVEGTWEITPESNGLSTSYFDPSMVDLGSYEVQFIPDDSCLPSSLIAINVHDDCVVLPCDSENDPIISKAITPNGDPYNEYFTVEGLDECGFKMELQVFNRWGAIVYKSSDYQNNWNGYAIGSSGASQVPNGTYFYILTIVDSGIPPIKGYIYVGTSSK